MKMLVLVVLIGGVWSRSAIRQAAQESDYMPHADPNSAGYDHESFLGSDKAREFDQLPAREAKARLQRIIPYLDEDGNGQISEDELHDWIKRQLLAYIMDDARNLHEGNDVNHDGYVSWKEYVATTYGLGFVDNEQQAPQDGEFDYREMILRDYNKFITADANGDQFLSIDEMAAFIHPEEFHHTKDLALQESMNDLDRNKDGYITLDEYVADLLADEEDENVNRPEWIETEKKQFLSHRDKNGDGKVDINELREWLNPGGAAPAQVEAKHLMRLSDSDKDGLLTPEEIVNNFRVFVGSQATDFGRMLHNEL